jgi:hypothetical protein
MKRLFFDNKQRQPLREGSLSFCSFARFRFTYVSLTSQTLKKPNCPILEGFKYGGAGYVLEGTPGGCFKYAPLMFVVKIKAARASAEEVRGQGMHVLTVNVAEMCTPIILASDAGFGYKICR